jgi:hypothetical protein
MSVPSKLQLFITSVIRTLHKHTPRKGRSASPSSPTHRSSEDVVTSDIQPELSQTYPLPLPPEERSDKLEILTSHMLSSAASYDHGTAPVSSSNCRIMHLGADASSLLLSQAHARIQSFHDLRQLTPADTLGLASSKRAEQSARKQSVLQRIRLHEMDLKSAKDKVSECEGALGLLREELDTTEENIRIIDKGMSDIQEIIRSVQNDEALDIAISAATQAPDQVEAST